MREGIKLCPFSVFVFQVVQSASKLSAVLFHSSLTKWISFLSNYMYIAYSLKQHVPLNYTNEGKQLFHSDQRLPQMSWPTTLSLLRYYSIKRYVPAVTIWKTNNVLCQTWWDGCRTRRGQQIKLEFKKSEEIVSACSCKTHHNNSTMGSCHCNAF